MHVVTRAGHLLLGIDHTLLDHLGRSVGSWPGLERDFHAWVRAEVARLGLSEFNPG